MEAIHVVKLGGSEGNDLAGAARDAARLWRAGRRLVLVHGGSAEATRLGEELGSPARFVQSPSGHTSRLTDARTLDVFLMATALVNRRLVSVLRAAGVPALGLSGLDGGCLEAVPKSAFRVVEEGRVRVVRGDLSGKPVGANGELLRSLLGAGYLPVLAPVGSTPQGQALNVDGDRAAACVAGELKAASLALLTSAPGLLRDRFDASTLVRKVSAETMPEAMRWAEGPMKKKVLAASEALSAGVDRIFIASSAAEHPVESAWAGSGTCFTAEEVFG